MNILALDSALNNSYIALLEEKETYSKIIKSDENYHSLYLVKEIKDFLKSNLDAIAINCGPGSFTGIRVALSVAKVIAGELDLPLIPLNTSEILLNAYEADVFLMDARRDMYYFGDKEKIELIYKNKLTDKLRDFKGKVVCDKRSFETIEHGICFEENERDLGKTMLKLAFEKFSQSQDRSEFNYLKVSANYIQTPPIFGNC